MSKSASGRIRPPLAETSASPCEANRTFSRDPRKAAVRSFDRETSAPIDPAVLKSYAVALAQYHLSPEAKFQNGEFLDSGRTERRCVRVTGVSHIGKEANNLEQQYFLDREKDEQMEYGAATGAELGRLNALCEKLGEREIAKKVGIARASLRKLRRHGLKSMSWRVQQRILTM